MAPPPGNRGGAGQIGGCRLRRPVTLASFAAAARRVIPPGAWATGARSSAAPPGLIMGGPAGAVFGAALGHAADSGAMPNMRLPFGGGADGVFSPARIAARLGRKDQVFAICVVVLAAKLAKCDGPVGRAEIDAFKRQFRIPPEAMADIGRLFDQAREAPMASEAYATQLGEAFSDNRGHAGGRAHLAVHDRPRRRAGEPERARVPLAGPRRLRARPAFLGPRPRRRAPPAAMHRGAAIPTSCSASRARRPGRNARRLEAADAGEPSRQPGLARGAGRIHRPRQRQGGADQRRLGPDQARARHL